MDLGWTSDTENVHDDILCETLETKVRSFSEDQGLGQIVKERLWTLDFHFASKIVLQHLEADTDAQLHKERVFSVRKEAKFASTREMSQVECGHPGNLLSM